MAAFDEKNQNSTNTFTLISTTNDDHEYWDDELDEDILTFCGDVEKEELMKKVAEQTKISSELYNKRVENPPTPLERFRPGYLWVSDLTKQNWCEQQLYYSFTVPGVVAEDKPSMKEGTSLHLARELAVHEPVRVKVTSNEDIWAVKVMNLLDTVQGFLNGANLAREVPIFGAPFDKGVFFVGLIDELRFDPELYTVTLSELKTKSYKSPPSKAQKSQHKLQVMLYQKLFDDLVKGQVSKETVAKHLRVDLTQEFGDDVISELEKHLIDFKNLEQLLNYLFQKFQALTCINQLEIEYVHQESKETIFHSSVDYDDTELESLLDHYLKFWKGEREILGVDIEDAWKCGKCDFSDMCEWRQKKSQECSNRNSLKQK